ncbi:NAD(P)-dependent oxidoreductase [Desulfobulbus rhabdoformis]|uniref:NAD(P)-dependent oxidoreductase n=1 Tax=Desulfobulbus rhabdoformis TaxID=34032 RepID=UPI0019660A97|nr:NAD(P)-dependent oxidoreductase [Desulfobulbus rhabdoformis]MBM9614047.1 NAD(P)-dependent oxidoreductase [Desulfobulbus rhabdoformis]
MHIREQLAIPRQLPRELDAEERLDNFDEVSKGFDEQTALVEANRCLQCRKPPCIMGCPIGNDIPRFIALMRERKFEEAYWTIRETSSMPSICSRVCPHEFQCEGACIRAKKDAPVAIGLLERFLADWMIINGKNLSPRCAPKNGLKVAIIGSGPAGITVAHALSHRGYNCTIFESLPVFGGMLSVGIPNYRLPRNIIGAELYALQQCGVNVKTGITVGQDLTLSELREQGYSSVFLGIGAYKSKRLGLDGENSTKGVMSGVDYLVKVLTGHEIALGDRVLVVGGGNVAIDVARVALRSGWKNVSILYRRTRDEMPASKMEVHHVEEEGVDLQFLTTPTRIISQNGQLTGVECIRMELGEVDITGRCVPRPQPGSEFIIEADALIGAVGQKVIPVHDATVPVEITPRGTYVVDPVTLQTSVDWIFAGGDTVLGPQTVAKAVCQGLDAAESMHRYMQGLI